MSLSIAQYEALQTLATADESSLSGIPEFTEKLKLVIKTVQSSRTALACALKSHKIESFQSYLPLLTQRKKPKNPSPEVARARIFHAFEILRNVDFFPEIQNSLFTFIKNDLSEQLHVFTDELQLQNRYNELLIGIFGTPLPAAMLSLLNKLKNNKEEPIELTEEEEKNMEIFRLIEKMEADYRKELDRLEFYELVDENSHIPTFSEIMATFTPEMLRNVIEHKFQEPKLVLIPPKLDLKALKKAIDVHRTMEGQEETWIHGQTYDDSSPKQWQTFMVEGTTIMPPLQTEQFTDNINAILEDRLNAFDQAYKNTSIQGVDRFGYAHLMMAGLMNGQPIDSRIRRNEEGEPITDQRGNLTYDWNPTLLNKDKICKEKPLKHVPDAGWYPNSRKVYFYSYHPRLQNAPARLRRSVGGDVPMT